MARTKEKWEENEKQKLAGVVPQVRLSPSQSKNEATPLANRGHHDHCAVIAMIIALSSSEP